MRNKRQAFTLVELLVVIGIISLLIGILVPALNKAKQSSENAKCLSNLRQLGMAAQLHSNDYHSRIPPAGLVIPAGDEGKSPWDGFKNPWRELQWYDNGGIPQPVPWIAAYAKYLAIPIRTDTSDHMAEDLDIRDRMKVFTCPSQRKVPKATMITGSFGAMPKGQGISVSGPMGFSSYGFNEQIMGADPTAGCHEMPPHPWPTPQRRLFGRIQNLNNTSHVMLFGDAVPRSNDNIPGFFSFWDNITDQVCHEVGPSLQDPNNWGTLAETLMEVPLIPKGMRDKNFDYERHSNRTMNIVFLDGHCEGVKIDELALREVIVDPIYHK